MKKYILPYLLVFGGFGLIAYYNWQTLVGVILMLIGGFIWQMARGKSPGLGEPGHYTHMKKPVPPPPRK